MDKQVLQKDIKGIISSITGISEDKFDDRSNFIDDLGIESVMAVNIVTKVEEFFQIDVPVDRVGELDSLGSIVELVHSLKYDVV